MKTFKDPRLNRILSSRLKEKTPLIQVILGPRQVGKTTFIADYLRGNKEKFLLVSGDGIQDPTWILEKWGEATELGIGIVIDEVQKIPRWSEMIKVCWDGQKLKKNKIKCILLGSSSMSLQQGLSESLTGRFELISAYHWSYEDSKNITKMSFNEYLLYGGYPGSYSFRKDSERWQQYMRSSIVETVISKDILMQAQVKSPGLFRQCFYLLTSLPGQVVSYNKLLGQLQDKGNIDLVKYYMDLFEGAYLIRQLHKYSKNEIRKRLSSPKILVLAPSLCTFHRLDNLNPESLGRVFESLVGSQLVKHFEQLFYWADGDYEVDFVIEFRGITVAIEVKSDRHRKSKSLEVFLKKYPKAKAVFITQKNYQDFEKDPRGFIERAI